MAVLLFQDLLVVVFMLMIPLLANGGGNVVGALGGLLLGLATVAGILIAGRTLIPGLLHQIVRTRNRELFLIAIFVVCIGTATLTAWAGLSLRSARFWRDCCCRNPSTDTRRWQKSCRSAIR